MRSRATSPTSAGGYDTPPRATRVSAALLALLALSGAAGAVAPPPPGAALPALQAQRDHASGTYRVGETVGWTITLAAGKDPTGYHYLVARNGLEVLASGALHFNGNTARLEVPASEPAMLFVQITSPVPTEAPLTLGAAVEPERLQPVVPKPADFASFWQGKLAQLAAVPAAPLLSPGASERDGVEYATVTLASVDGGHIHGQIARPVAGERFPGLIIFQWAGGPYPLQKQWVTDRAAEGWLALNIEPHDVLPDQPQAYYDALPMELKSYQLIGRDDRDRSYFLRMYLADYRAIEYLASRPDWDGRTLVVMGTSMGGQQSLCAAALNPRVTAVIVDEPAGADTNAARHGRLNGYPNWPPDDDLAMRAARYFDTVNCASQIRAPTLIAMGFTDTTAPPAGIWTAFNQITAPKEAVPMVDSAHNNFATAEQQRPYTERAAQWLEALRTKGKPPLAGQ